MKILKGVLHSSEMLPCQFRFMRLLFSYFIILLFFPLSGFTQGELDVSVGIGDSLAEPEHGFFYRPKIVLGLGGHNSLVGGEKVRIGGMRLGLEFRHKWRFGVGLNYLNPAIFRTGGDEINPVFYRIDFAYFNIFGEYIILNNRRWEFSFPLVLGGGATTVSSRASENGIWVPDRVVGLTVSQVSAVGYYKIWKWLGIGASMGYRNVTSKDENDPALSKIVTTAFDGPTWAIKTKIYVGELWRALFKKKDKKKKKDKQKTLDTGPTDSM